MGAILSIIIGAVITFIMILVRIAIFFLTHLDVTNSILANTFIQMLTIKQPWSSNLRIGMFVVGFAVFLILQNVSKIVKGIFCLLSACLIAAFAYIWKDYDNVLQRNIITLLWFGIGLLLNIVYGAQGITKGEVA